MYFRYYHTVIIIIIFIFLNSTLYAYDKEKFGIYEDLRLQGIFAKKIGTSDPYKTAATEIQFRLELPVV